MVIPAHRKGEAASRGQFSGIPSTYLSYKARINPYDLISPTTFFIGLYSSGNRKEFFGNCREEKNSFKDYYLPMRLTVVTRIFSYTENLKWFVFRLRCTFWYKFNHSLAVTDHFRRVSPICGGAISINAIIRPDLFWAVLLQAVITWFTGLTGPNHASHASRLSNFEIGHLASDFFHHSHDFMTANYITSALFEYHTHVANLIHWGFTEMPKISFIIW